MGRRHRELLFNGCRILKSLLEMDIGDDRITLGITWCYQPVYLKMVRVVNSAVMLIVS